MRLILCGLLLLAGCGGATDEGERERAEDRETVFDPMVRNIDKSKQVEQQVLDQKRKTDDALEAAEGGQD